MKPDIQSFFDPDTFTVSYVVSDPETRTAAIVDSVLDFNPNSGRTATTSADRIVKYVRENGLRVEWLLETHAHADHLSGAPYLRSILGGRIGIGEHIRDVQKVFKPVFNAEADFATDGRQFDHLFTDGEEFRIGQLSGRVLHTPGHTPACVAYVIGDAAFVGDTLFMPDGGTARTDFPGGDARTLYRSIKRVLSLPAETRLLMCHDYSPNGRTPMWETTVAEQRAKNIHVRDGISEDEFVAMRRTRDRTLDMPRLLMQSVQVNMRAGELPPAEDNGVRYLKIPLNAI
jgi:glyoxylase-like metal-dependent hydrolase (beta-lactamase superfamily II)